MRREVKSAVDFLSNILKNRQVGDLDVDNFRQTLHVMLCSHYQNHWFPEKPMKGSGYRCIRINHKMDPLLSQAGGQCGLSENELFELFPKELTLWIDPQEVSYRIGEDGSVGVIFGDGEETETSSGNDQSNNNAMMSPHSESSSAPGSPQSTSQSPSPPPSMVTPAEFLQSCKSQFRCFGLESAADAINFEYLQSHLATFVTS
jgi:protein Tob/BTG